LTRLLPVGRVEQLRGEFILTLKTV
jgi:hypothetical protein